MQVTSSLTSILVIFFFFFGFDTKIKGYDSKNNQLGPHQIESFYTTKETINSMKVLPN